MVSTSDNMDYVKSMWQGEGWYRIAYSDGLKWDLHWYEYPIELREVYQSAYRSATEFHLPYIEYFGDGVEPDYDR